MFLRSLEVTPKSLVSDIVARDYRTAEIFRKYGIEYCCGGKWPVETICLMNGIELPVLITEIEKITRTLQLPRDLPFATWEIDFLADYIINIHHHYLKQSLPDLGNELEKFATEHIKKYPHYQSVLLDFRKLENEILPHIRQEETTIFPYLRQVAHAYKNQDSFAKLLVKTLRKPIGQVMDHDHTILNDTVYKLRQLTNHYTSPEKACTNHVVILAKLKELDHDLMQHIYLENEILYPRVIAMEKELLSQ